MGKEGGGEDVIQESGMGKRIETVPHCLIWVLNDWKHLNVVAKEMFWWSVFCLSLSNMRMFSNLYGGVDRYKNTSKLRH